MADLFTAKPRAPLAELLRPKSLDEFVGQQHLLGPGKPLRLAFEARSLHSFIMWGPPGVGKTTLGRLAAMVTDSHFIAISAVLAGVKDIRQAIDDARAELDVRGRSTVLFVDEIHRFNKAQQDALLPHVESGLLTLVGGTTEHPGLAVNSALLSRAQVYTLEPLSDADLEKLYERARPHLRGVDLSDPALQLLKGFADGDGRRFLNLLEQVSTAASEKRVEEVDLEFAKRSTSPSLRRFDKGGDEFYWQLSAFHKSLRGSDPDASLYWLARILDGGGDVSQVTRRMIVMASEDIGNADPGALHLAIHAAQAYERLGSPEGEIVLAQAATYLALSPKSNASYAAWDLARAFVKEHGSLPVPMHLRNAPAKLMRQMGYRQAYRYAHHEPDGYAAGQTYLPEGVERPNWYRPTDRGAERALAERQAWQRALDEEASQTEADPLFGPVIQLNLTSTTYRDMHMPNATFGEASCSVAASGLVEVRGARENNLRDVDVSIPRNALVVFSGVSGSGKSSLAFGTIYAEAQRRYFESVAPYARRLIDQAGVPDVDSIDGLPPAVALQQQRGASNARSSVGSVTTLSSLIRMMYSRAGAYPADQPMLYAEDFSPNTPQGACATCHGLGHVYEVTEALMVPDPKLSIRERAIASWPPAWHGQNLRDILVTLGYDIDRPWKDLPKKDRDWILFTEESPTVPVYAGFTPAETRAALKRKTEPSYMGTFTGARRYVLHTFANTQSALMRRRVSRYMEGKLCPTCHGKRLKAESLSVTFAGVDIGQFMQMPLDQLASLLEPISQGDFSAHAGGGKANKEATRRDRADRAASGRAVHAVSPDVRRTSALSEEKRLAAQRLASGVMSRISQLRGLGLGYLTLDRATPTLSAGELQRLRLATQLSSLLFGVVYVLDEPSAGLHPSDSQALYDALDRLRDGGNSVFVVEHDLELMRRAQWLVDVGPEAGERGGKVLYSGEPDGLRDIDESRTALYLFDKVPPPSGQERQASGWLELQGIQRHNLKRIDAKIPLGILTAVTGISGSGKSSLVAQALPELMMLQLGHEPEDDAVETGAADGPTVIETTGGHLGGDVDAIQRLVQVDQKPIGRTPRSNLATYTGLFDHVRKLFAATPDARRRRYDAGRFSFNVAKGRCETCEGEGFVSVELLFMPSVYAPCPTCHGARYNEATLKVLWNGKNIADVLRMTVEDAREFFGDEDAIARPLQLLKEIGLGYLRLGQPATELSGGEAQRIKLATELQRSQRGRTLYVLDEPTTGLHASDADRLLVQLQRLVDAGNTVVMIEHDMRAVAQADWVIDVGPGAGDAGGQIVAAGTPKQVARVKRSRTAPFLAEELARAG